MKYILSLMILLSFGCGSKTETTQENGTESLIKQWVDKNLNDPASYQAMDTIKIEDADFYQTNEGIALLNDLATAEAERAAAGAVAAVFNESDTLKAWEKFNEAKKRYDAAESEFKNKGYKMFRHRFRAKNSFGALVIQDYLFITDRDLTTIVEAKNLKDLQK